METALRHTSVGIRCELLWTGVKCNFSSAQLHEWYVDGKLPISRIRMWNFTRIRQKTKKLWLSIIPARRQWPATTHKRCELPLIFAAIGQAVRRWKALDLGSLNMQFQQDWPKDKKLQLFKFFTRKLREISLDWALWCASREISNFFFSPAPRAVLPWIALH